jgi:hypothetical protein
MANHDKVPSVISYSAPSLKGEQQWGSSLSEDAVAMVHTKLELELNDITKELDSTIQALNGMQNLRFQDLKSSTSEGRFLGYTHKGPEEIISDYLNKVLQYLRKDLSPFAELVSDALATDLVVTIPAVSSSISLGTSRLIIHKGWSYTGTSHG